MFVGKGREGPANIGRDHGPIKGGEPALLQHRDLEHGYVAIANKYLGISSDNAEVYVGQHAGRARASLSADNRVDFMIGKGSIQIISAIRVLTRKEKPAIAVFSLVLKT